jgi:hypothetical protein
MMDKEQIKKLAMQAGEYTNEVYVPPVRSKTPGKIWEDGHVGWHDIFNEKFAELVAAHEREQVAKERKAIAAMVKPLDESLADEILDRGNHA